MNRTPPKPIRRALRREVGFGCPIPDCGSPYLTWHHFDPPWSKHQHHNQAGMIAMCEEHHRKADQRTWTPGQLRELKRAGKGSRQQVKGKFDWMRSQLLGVLGGNFYLDVPILFYCSRQPIIWFTQDHKGYLKVNLRRPLTDRTAEWVMKENDWIVNSDVADIECPPSGHFLAVTYPNGDYLRIRFNEYPSVVEAAKRYPDGATVLGGLHYPLVAVDFQVKVPALDISIESDKMVLPGHTVFKGCLMECSKIGIALGEVIA